MPKIAKLKKNVLDNKMMEKEEKFYSICKNFKNYGYYRNYRNYGNYKNYRSYENYEKWKKTALRTLMNVEKYL